MKDCGPLFRCVVQTLTRGRAWLRRRWDALKGELRIEGEFAELQGMADSEFESVLASARERPRREPSEWIGILFLLGVFSVPYLVLTAWWRGTELLLWQVFGWAVLTIAAHLYLARNARYRRRVLAISDEEERRFGRRSFHPGS